MYIDFASITRSRWFISVSLSPLSLVTSFLDARSVSFLLFTSVYFLSPFFLSPKLINWMLFWIFRKANSLFEKNEWFSHIYFSTITAPFWDALEALFRLEQTFLSSLVDVLLGWVLVYTFNLNLVIDFGQILASAKSNNCFSCYKTWALP